MDEFTVNGFNETVGEDTRRRLCQARDADPPCQSTVLDRCDGCGYEICVAHLTVQGATVMCIPCWIASELGRQQI